MNNLLLICGDEFEVSQEVENIKSKYNKLEKGINFLTFDKDNINLLGDELSTYSFFQEPKLIIVRLSKSSKKESAEEEEEQNKKETKSTKSFAWFDDRLKDQILNMLDNIELIFVDYGTPNSMIKKFISEYGVIKTLVKKNNYDITKYIIEYASTKDLKISREDAVYMGELSGGDLRTISNYIDILQDYVESGIITKDALDKICIKTPETIIFDLTDSMGENNKANSIEFLDNLLDSKEPIQKILVMLTRHFKTLILAKECVERGLSIEKELNVKSYPAKKYKEQSSNFSKEQLIKIFKELYKFDVEGKQIQIDAKIALQRVIMM